MHRPKPLREYPPATLHRLHAAVTALLSHHDMLPADLHVTLDLLRGDITTALGPARHAPPRSPRTPNHPSCQPGSPTPKGTPR